MSHNFSKKSFFLLGSAIGALTLSACGAVEPTFIPKGYSHHGKIYKSKTPPPSQRVTNAQRVDMGPVQAEQFRSATYDILARLTTRAGLPPKPAYIEAANPMTPFYANIDNDLREAMRAQGYRLSDTSEGAYIFKYNAELLPGYRSYDHESAPMGAPNIGLTLDVLTDIQGTLKPLTKEIGNYYIQGAEALLIPAPHHKSLNLSDHHRYKNEAGMIEPRTENTFHSMDGLRTIQPVMDKTTAPIVDIIEAPASPVFVEPQEFIMTMPSEPMAPYMQSAPVMVSPQEYVMEPAAPMMNDNAAVQIFDPETATVKDSYDYSASMNEMNSIEPMRRGPRVSKQVEY